MRFGENEGIFIGIPDTWNVGRDETGVTIIWALGIGTTILIILAPEMGLALHIPWALGMGMALLITS